MDKEKQIEEIVKFLQDRIINKTWRAEKVAKGLYEITVPKDSVVLSRKEYEMLNYFNHRGEELLKQERKETAEKILITAIQLSDMCRDFYEFQNRLVDLIETNYGVKIERKQIIPAQQVGVEIKE